MTPDIFPSPNSVTWSFAVITLCYNTPTLSQPMHPLQGATAFLSVGWKMINLRQDLTVTGQCAPLAGQVSSTMREAPCFMHEFADLLTLRKCRIEQTHQCQTCGRPDDTDLLLLGYLKSTADSQLARDTSPFVTGNQNLILEGAALGVINKRGTRANEGTPRRPEWLHLTVNRIVYSILSSF